MGKKMDEALLKERTHMLFTCLTMRDPRSTINHMMLLREFIRKYLLERGYVPQEITDKLTFQIAKDAARKLIVALEKDNRWSECVGSWYAEDIYNLMQCYVAQVV